jgi:hypothetical protein
MMGKKSLPAEILLKVDVELLESAGMAILVNDRNGVYDARKIR